MNKLVVSNFILSGGCGTGVSCVSLTKTGALGTGNHHGDGLNDAAIMDRLAVIALFFERCASTNNDVIRCVIWSGVVFCTFT